uniref:Insulin-like domain-containing protein n=1 Tax=Varanus komodoensis TaxID=61221 RepID=A0A8D2J1M4_VARKO
MKGTVLGLLFLSFFMAVYEVKSEGSPIKLCGREFVRAVIFTCGGSRWRRELTDLMENLIGNDFNYINCSNTLVFACNTQWNEWGYLPEGMDQVLHQVELKTCGLDPCLSQLVTSNSLEVSGWGQEVVNSSSREWHQPL